MWVVAGVVLLFAWAMGFLVFKVASAALHLLIVAAVVAGVIHLYKGYKARHGASTA